MNGNLGLNKPLIFAAIIALPASVALAENRQQLTAVTEVRYDDNIFLDASDQEQEEYQLIGGFDYLFEGEGSRYKATLDYRGRAAYDDKDTQEDDTEFSGTASIVAKLIEDRITWRIYHERSEQRADRRDVDIRQNRETRNLYGTGPTMQLPLTRVDALSLEVDHQEIRYQGSDNPLIANTRSDSERDRASLQFSHQTSSVSTVFAGYTYIESSFDNDDDDIEFEQSFIGYRSELADGEYSVQIGYNESERDNGETAKGELVQVNWTRSNAARELNITAIKQLSDSSAGIGIGVTGYDPVENGNYGDIDIVDRTYVDVDYVDNRLCKRCSVAVGLTYNDEDFESTANDEVETGYRASINYRMNRRTSLLVGADMSTIEFDAEDREDDWRDYFAKVNWEVARRTSLSLRLTQEERESDAALIDDYEDFSVELILQHEVL